jgi:hypothetical protein
MDYSRKIRDINDLKDTTRTVVSSILAFLKLWSVYHKWSSGSDLLVLLD